MPGRKPTNSPSAGRPRARKLAPLERYRQALRDITLDNGQPFVLQAWQEWLVADLLSGIRELHIRIPEENGKTTFVAALNLLHLCEHPNPRAVVAARNENQAGILYRQCVAMIESCPELERRLVIREGTNEIRLAGRHGNVGLKVIPADELSAHGALNTRVTIDEMHALPGLGLYRVLSRKLGKRAGAQLLAISTAGEPDSEYELMWAEMLDAEGKERRGERCWRVEGPQHVAWCWALEKDDDVDSMAVVKLANPLESITLQSLQAKRDLPGHNPTYWKQVVCNLPTRDPVMRFLAEGDWDAANVSEDCPEIPEGVPIILGADWGWKDDATALVPAWYDEDGMLLLGSCTVIEPPRDGTELKPAEVFAALDRIAARNPIDVIAHDESAHGGGIVMTGLLGERYTSTEVVPVTQSDANDAPGHFNEQLRMGKLKHTGDATLRRHLMNAIRVPIKEDPERFRITRPKESRHAPHQRPQREIDGAVAAVNAVWGAIGREPSPEPFAFVIGE